MGLGSVARIVAQERTPRLADRLAASRRARFVGREAELELFRMAVQASEPRFAVLHVHGPGGVGKTALLNEYARYAGEAGAVAVRVDGHDVDPSPPGFMRALAQALAVPEGGSALAALSQLPRAVLLIDTYEALARLDDWLREAFLPQLPARTMIVIAGRNSPAAAWRTDPDWSDLARILSLRNLPPNDSRSFLRARGIPEDQHVAALAFTHGHPLALALVADLLARGHDPELSLEHAPDVVRVLLERFVEHVPSPAHRRGLEVCARTRVTTESLLAEVVGPTHAPELFEWLRGLSFIEQRPTGLFPHDMARDVLDAELRWRDPQGFTDLHRQVLRYLVRRLQAHSGREQQRAYFDFVYLSRNSPLMRSYYDWDVMATEYADAVTPEDHEAILAMVRQHEGESSQRVADFWLQRRPDAFLAFRDARQYLTGFVANLLMDEADAEECAADPAVAAAWRFVGRRGSLRPGERLMHVRFWMSRAGYQDRAAVTLAAAVAAPRWLTTPGLAWTFLALADPDSRATHFSAIGFSRVPDADFEVGTRRFGVVAHDWRLEPPLAWIERKGQLDPDVGPAPTQAARPPLLVLSRPDFDAAVRQALRDYTRPAALTANPLLRSRLVVGHADDLPTPASLQAVLRAAAESLSGTPRDRKLYRALERTYLEPAESQEAAAELLGLPFSTYRYQLSNAMARTTEWLWRRELELV